MPILAFKIIDNGPAFPWDFAGVVAAARHTGVFPKNASLETTSGYFYRPPFRRFAFLVGKFRRYLATTGGGDDFNLVVPVRAVVSVPPRSDSERFLASDGAPFEPEEKAWIPSTAIIAALSTAVIVATATFCTNDSNENRACRLSR